MGALQLLDVGQACTSNRAWVTCIWRGPAARALSPQEPLSRDRLVVCFASSIFCAVPPSPCPTALSFFLCEAQRCSMCRGPVVPHGRRPPVAAVVEEVFADASDVDMLVMEGFLVGWPTSCEGGQANGPSAGSAARAAASTPAAGHLLGAGEGRNPALLTAGGSSRMGYPMSRECSCARA